MIFVLNCGSQSIKYKVFNKGQLDIAGEGQLAHPKDYEQELRKILEKAKEDFKISAIGHRVVHGGDFFREAAIIGDNELESLEKINDLAPLHNPFNILGIKISREIFGDLPNIAVFDTGFFKDLPQRAAVYALPQYINENYGFRRFGFHGISHQYAAEEAAEKLGKPLAELKLITCHLGGGSSITAVKGGKAIDTSMGFTPMEGLIMATRCGDVDPGIIIYLCKELGVENAEKILNEKSGLWGICENSDMLEILNLLEKGDSRAKKAFELYVYKIKKYIGAYYAILGGCDALIFTGAIGAGKPKTRGAVCEGLKILEGVEILANSSNEELAIAKQILDFKL